MQIQGGDQRQEQAAIREQMQQHHREDLRRQRREQKDKERKERKEQGHQRKSRTTPGDGKPLDPKDEAELQKVLARIKRKCAKRLQALQDATAGLDDGSHDSTTKAQARTDEKITYTRDFGGEFEILLGRRDGVD